MTFKIDRSAWLATVALLGSLTGSGFAQTPNYAPAPMQTTAYDAYLPIDHWAYSALDRLVGMGYLDSAFLGIRPWTRRNIAMALDNVNLFPESADSDPEAFELVAKLRREFPAIQDEVHNPYLSKPIARVESAYTRIRGIQGTPLDDGWHLGQSYENDYGRPYQSGFNAVLGESAMAQAGRFSLYVRGEYQHAPSWAGYSATLANNLWYIDSGFTSNVAPKQRLIPQGFQPAANQFRLLEGYASFRILDHQISLGKMDHWLSPARGGSFAYSNNAEAQYAFQIDRTTPLHVPVLSALTGPFRYTFFVGSLKGHTTPNAPWSHTEKLSFQPYRDLEFGFTRTIIWGGKGHQPITLGTFLHGFFHLQNTDLATKLSRDDPGARFSMFDLRWRLPWLRNWLMLYVDSLSHDDVFPISAPRRAGIRPGLYLSRIPGAQRFDLRAEGWNTDPPTTRSNAGAFLYAEYIHRDGYTNQGFIMGDFAGRESKGGQLWLGWHPQPQNKIELSYRYTKAAKDFVPLGTTQHIVRADINWKLRQNVEASFQFQHELWKAPIYLPGQQSINGITGGLRWYPDQR